MAKDFLSEWQMDMIWGPDLDIDEPIELTPEQEEARRLLDEKVSKCLTSS